MKRIFNRRWKHYKPLASVSTNPKVVVEGLKEPSVSTSVSTSTSKKKKIFKPNLVIRKPLAERIKMKQTLALEQDDKSFQEKMIKIPGEKRRKCNHVSVYDREHNIKYCRICDEVLDDDPGKEDFEEPIKFGVKAERKPDHMKASGRRHVPRPHNIQFRYRRKKGLPSTLSPKRSVGRPRNKPAVYPLEEDVVEVKNLNQAELIKLGKEKGIKNVSKMTKKEICREVGVKMKEKPTKVILTNMETEETHRFPSLNNASVVMKVSKGSLSYSAKNDTRLKIGGVKYKVERL